MFFCVLSKSFPFRAIIWIILLTFAHNPKLVIRRTVKDKESEMKCVLILVGKTTDKHQAAIISDYVERIVHYMPFSVEVIPDLKNTKSLSFSQQKEREGEQILRRITSSDHVVLLDERGDERRSVDFASWLEHKIQQVRRLVFVIGGPYGFSDAVYSRSNESISLSRMTFSHQMVRMIFTEQLYRACTIIKGEPYHHE